MGYDQLLLQDTQSTAIIFLIQTLPSLHYPTYTPTRATSRIIITATIVHNQHHVYSFGVKRDGTLLTSGAANSNNSNTGGGADRI